MKLSIFGASIAVAIFSIGVQSCAHGTSLQPRDGTISPPKFGYAGLQGPLNWAALSPENQLCETGKNQSPINLNTGKATVDDGRKYVLNIPNTQGSEFENLGTTVEVTVNGTLTTSQKQYELAQFHFHTPSEHRIDDEYFPMETHFVFEAADKSRAVIGFLIDLGHNDPLLGAVLPTVNKIPTLGSATITPPLSFAALSKHLRDNTVFRYSGSLTTPPCAEQIEWIVSTKPLTVNMKNFQAVKKVVKFNSRYTQNDIGQ